MMLAVLVKLRGEKNRWLLELKDYIEKNAIMKSTNDSY